MVGLLFIIILQNKKMRQTQSCFSKIKGRKKVAREALNTGSVFPQPVLKATGMYSPSDVSNHCSHGLGSAKETELTV